MAEWQWEVSPDDLLSGLPAEAITEVERLALEIATRDSMVYLDGASYTGSGPGLQTESRGGVLLTYLTDVRGKRIVVIQVAWFS